MNFYFIIPRFFFQLGDSILSTVTGIFYLLLTFTKNQKEINFSYKTGLVFYLIYLIFLEVHKTPSVDK
jgi:glucose uptake protein GlcU